MTSPMLETPRLILRPPTLDDLDDWAALMADADAARFIGGVQPRSMCWRSIMLMAGSWSLSGFGFFSVIEKATGGWIGRVGPWNPEGWPGPEIGWGIRREAWGKGYAFEASAAAMGWAFETLGWPTALHVIHPDNARSRALARRLGSTPRGPCRLPAPWHAEEMELWGQDAATWARR